MSDNEIEKLKKALCKPTPGNCWWATYRVVPAVSEVMPERVPKKKI